MKQAYRFFLQCSILSVSVLSCAVLSSCASTGKAVQAGNQSEGRYEGEPQPAADTETSTQIAVPKKSGRTYFSKIDGKTMALVENGSPESLRSALSAIRKPELDYTENEKVLIAVVSGIMKMTWPSEQTDWDVPEVTEQTPYLGAIDSAKQGIYDLSTGNVDFLTLVLPSLVVISSDDVSGYAGKAEQALLSGLDLRPDSVLADYLLGMLYKKEGQTDKALERFTLASQHSPLCLEAAYEKGMCLMKLGRADEASVIADALVSRYPTKISVLKLSAETSFALKSYSSAEEYVARVLQQDPNDLQYVLFRARILAEKGDYIRAASLLDVYARQDSTSRGYLLLRARIQRDWSKNTGAAAATIETAMKRYPDDAEVQLFAAQLASVTGQTIAGKTAEELAGSVLASDPGNTEALRCQIEGMIQNGNWQKAYSASEKLLAKDRSRAAVFSHIKICLELGKKDEAWNLVSPLYRENPADEDVLQMYILVLARTDRTGQALSLIDSLLPNASARMKSFLYYRRSYLEGAEDASLSDLRSSLIANPRNSDALFRLYQIYYNRKDYRKAQYYLKQVVALDPNNASVRKLNDDLSKLIK